ncbi:MAG: hypothetical protein ACTHOU_11200, partial [Aureliella sp.]
GGKLAGENAGALNSSAVQTRAIIAGAGVHCSMRTPPVDGSSATTQDSHAFLLHVPFLFA